MKAADLMDTKYPVISFLSTKEELEAASKFCVELRKSDPFADIIIPVHDGMFSFLPYPASPDLILGLSRPTWSAFVVLVPLEAPVEPWNTEQTTFPFLSRD